MRTGNAMLLGYRRAVDALSEACGRVATWLVPACVLTAFVNVVLHYVGRYQHRALASNRYLEAQWMLFGALFLLAFPYALKRGLNVRVDIVSQRWSPRRRALVDVVGHLVALVPYCLVALWVWWDYTLTFLFERGPRWGTWRVWETWERWPDPAGLPRAPIKVIALAGFASCSLKPSPSWSSSLSPSPAARTSSGPTWSPPCR